MQNRILYLFIVLLVAAGCSKPIANFTYSGADEPAPAKIDFENASEKAEIFEWDFGDGNKSMDASPEHQYKSSGNYTVILKAKKGKKESVMEKQVFITAPKDCLVEIQTEYGNMIAKLYNATPQHRDNFIKLVEDGFYDDLLFHRVIDGFMIQGGDPRSRNARPGQNLGSGGPGYQVPGEFVDTLVHTKGALAAARTGDAVNPERASSGSQFYIVHGQPLTDSAIDNFEKRKGITYSEEQRTILREEGGVPFLDKEYTVFGQVVEGLDVIDKISAVKTAPGDRPVKDVKMTIKLID